MALTILPAVQKGPSRSEKIGRALSGAFGKGLEMYEQHQQTQKENAKLKELTGMDFSGISGKLRDELAGAAFKGKMQREQDVLPTMSGQGQPPQGTDGENIPSFNYNDPKSWTDQQVDQLRSLQAKTPKAQTLQVAGENEFKRRETVKKETKKYKEEAGPFEGALNAIQEMRGLGKKGNLGFGLSIRKPFSSETRKDAAKYSTLGKSLIQFISDIPVRNKAEFEVMAHGLYEPSLTDAEREGILDALQQKIENSLRGLSNQQEGGKQTAPQAQQQRAPLESFMR